MTTTLMLDNAEGVPLVRSVRADAVLVADREFQRSFALWPGGLIEHWPVHDAAAMTPADLDALLDTGVAVILLGSGAARVQLAPAVLYRALSRGVGVEVMANDAAARTYNVLVGEQRSVLAAFILPLTSSSTVA